MDFLKEIDTFKRDEKGVRKLGAYAKKYSKADTEPGEMADLSALLEVSIEQIGSREIGRPPTYANTEDGLKDFLDATRRYFEYIKGANSVNEEKLYPDVEGWAIFIGITRQTILSYAKRNEAWQEAIEYIKDAILAAKKQLAFRFKIPPVIFLNDISNNHGYLNTSEFKITANNEHRGQQPEINMEELSRRRAEIQRRYAEHREMPQKPDLD